mmetsp:Transcript_11291/g.27769  ORF Transcript_11291/g.27769 Transcript_11291/m.27769 type:complete len:351 (+) Transcript_11291:284-1336(+)
MRNMIGSPRYRVIGFVCFYCLSTSFLALSLLLSTTTTRRIRHKSSGLISDPDFPLLSGDWSKAKHSLRSPKCCVVAVSGLEHHLSTLQQYFCGDNAPSDLDLRMRVRCKDNTIENVAYEDCSKIYNSVMGLPVLAKDAIKSEKPRGESDNLPTESNKSTDFGVTHPCILALEELARGVASLADGPLEGTCTDVHMRVVCASNYRAIDPMFHTDKCPLRGYVTLTGPGTEYMDETCLPWEYAAIRSLGVDGLSAVGGKAQSLKMANELEFIVMKGDHYEASLPDGTSSPLTERLWSRSSACLHRSPPGASSQRVILSLDLADGVDNQEWYEISRKRGWRSGMTQRKSRLVS